MDQTRVDDWAGSLERLHAVSERVRRDLDDLGAALHDARACGATHDDLAGSVGITRTTVRNWLRVLGQGGDLRPRLLVVHGNLNGVPRLRRGAA